MAITWVIICIPSYLFRFQRMFNYFLCLAYGLLSKSVVEEFKKNLLFQVGQYRFQRTQTVGFYLMLFSKFFNVYFLRAKIKGSDLPVIVFFCPVHKARIPEGVPLIDLSGKITGGLTRAVPRPCDTPRGNSAAQHDNAYFFILDPWGSLKISEISLLSCPTNSFLTLAILCVEKNQAKKCKNDIR